MFAKNKQKKSDLAVALRFCLATDIKFIKIIKF